MEKRHPVSAINALKAGLRLNLKAIERAMLLFELGSIYHKIERYSESLTYTRRALALTHGLGAEKITQGADMLMAMHRVTSMAHASLGHWEEAENAWFRAEHVNPKLFKELNLKYNGNELKRSIERREFERVLGEYPFAELYKDCIVDGNHRLDGADYIGPVKLADIPGQGRGIVASRDIQTGELLLVSKAMQATWGPEVLWAPDCLDIPTGIVRHPGRGILRKALLYQMQHNPEIAAKIGHLYAAPEGSRSVSAGDTPFPFAKGDIQSDPTHSVADAERLDQVLRYNAMRLSQLDYTDRRGVRDVSFVSGA